MMSVYCGFFVCVCTVMEAAELTKMVTVHLCEYKQENVQCGRHMHGFCVCAILETGKGEADEARGNENVLCDRHMHGFCGNRRIVLCDRHMHGFRGNRKMVHVVGTCVVLWKQENGPCSRHLHGLVETGEWSMWCTRAHTVTETTWK